VDVRLVNKTLQKPAVESGELHDPDVDSPCGG
jgi:hypothetical protein